MGIEDTLASQTHLLHEIATHVTATKKFIRDEGGKVSHVETELQSSRLEAARHEAFRDIATALQEVLGEDETAQLLKRMEAHIK